MLTSLPCWILIRIFVNYIPKEHPWYKKKFTLKDWHENQTDIIRAFDVMLWLWLFTVLGFLACMSKYHSIF